MTTRKSNKRRRSVSSTKQQRNVVRRYIPDEATPIEIHNEFIRPLEKMMATNPNGIDQLLDLVARYIWTAEDRCHKIHSEDLCRSNAPRCIWSPGKRTLWQRITRQGAQKGTCGGVSLADLGIHNMPPTIKDIKRLDTLYENLQKKEKQQPLTPNEKRRKFLLQTIVRNVNVATKQLTASQEHLRNLREQHQRLLDRVADCRMDSTCTEKRLEKLEAEADRVFNRIIRASEDWLTVVKSWAPYVLAFIMAASLIHLATGMFTAAGPVTASVHGIWLEWSNGTAEIMSTLRMRYTQGPEHMKKAAAMGTIGAVTTLVAGASLPVSAPLTLAMTLIGYLL